MLNALVFDMAVKAAEKKFGILESPKEKLKEIINQDNFNLFDIMLIVFLLYKKRGNKVKYEFRNFVDDINYN